MVTRSDGHMRRWLAIAGLCCTGVGAAILFLVTPVLGGGPNVQWRAVGYALIALGSVLQIVAVWAGA